MLVLYILLFSAACGGAFGNICDHTLIKSCSKLYENPPIFPKSAKDLEDLCPKVLSHIECMENYIDKCGFPHNEIDGEPESLTKIKRYVSDVCNQDSSIHADIVKELPCMKQSLGELNYTCQDVVRGAMRNYLEENEVDYTYTGSNRNYYCFYLTSRLSCIAAELDLDCGARARDLLLDAHFRTGYMDKVCDKDGTEEILKLVAVLEIESIDKEQIGGILRSYHGL